jgi:hypothetical protein
MEAEVHNEQVFEQQELTPAEQLRLQWRQQPGFIPFVKQKNVIDQNAELLPYAGVVSLAGWSSPRAFAIQGLVLVAAVTSLLNWYMTHDTGKRQAEIVALQANVQEELKRDQGIRDATEAEIKRISRPSRNSFQPVAREEALQQMQSSLEDSRKSEQEYKRRMAAREKDLRAMQRAEAIANSGTPLMFSLSLVFAAGLVASGLRRDYPRSNVRASGDYYLYLATAYGLWPNLILLVFLHFALSGSAYGLGGLSETVGPLFWVLFWIGFYAVLLRYFATVCREMRKATQIRPPASEWSLENKMLVRVNNSFLLMFVMLEAVFLSGVYLIYLFSRRFA